MPLSQQYALGEQKEKNYMINSYSLNAALAAICSRRQTKWIDY